MGIEQVRWACQQGLGTEATIQIPDFALACEPALFAFDETAYEEGNGDQQWSIILIASDFLITNVSLNIEFNHGIHFAWIWMNFHQSFEKCSILTSDIGKQPQTSSKSV